MPRHLAIDKNYQHYTVEFDNTKTVDLEFDKSFGKKPMVHLTPNDSGVMPVFKTNVTTSGVQIRFKTQWSGTVDVTVSER